MFSNFGFQHDSYHIAGSKGVFYAREPYSNIDAVHVTRFFGLAPVGNKEKQVQFLSSAFIYSVRRKSYLLP